MSDSFVILKMSVPVSWLCGN